MVTKKTTKMKKHMLIGIVMTLLILVAMPISFSATESINAVQNGQTISLSSVVLSGDFMSWSCDASGSRSATAFIDNCYCISVNGNEGVGYGDILSCLLENSTLSIASQNPVTMDLDITYALGTIPSPVTISSSDSSVTRSSEVSCNHLELSPAYREVFSFYDSSTTQVFYRGVLDTIDLSSTSIESGANLSCQVAYYDGGNLVAYTTSSNVLNIEDTSVVITNTYIAPAFPEFGDKIYCYGSSDYSVISGSMTHTFTFYANTIPVGVDTQIDSDPSSSKVYIGSYIVNQTSGTDITCDYSVVHSLGDSDLDISNSVTVQNSRPTIPIVTLAWNIQAPFGSGITKYYNADARKIVEFTDKGDVLLEGYCFETDNCGETLYDLGSVTIDRYGNLCAPLGCEKQSSCPSQNVSYSNGTATIISYGDTFCYSGNLFEDYYDYELINLTNPAIAVDGLCSETLDFCDAGAYINITDNSTHYKWMCSGINGGVGESCDLRIPIEGVCGSADGLNFDTAPTANLCSIGIASETGVWNWDCVADIAVSCSANENVDGGWTTWSDSTACSATCGGGTKDQVRSCTNPAPAFDGNDCSLLDGGNSIQTVSCNTRSCSGTWDMNIPGGFAAGSYSDGVYMVYYAENGHHPSCIPASTDPYNGAERSAIDGGTIDTHEGEICSTLGVSCTYRCRDTNWGTNCDSDFFITYTCT